MILGSDKRARICLNLIWNCSFNSSNRIMKTNWEVWNKFGKKYYTKATQLNWTVNDLSTGTRRTRARILGAGLDTPQTWNLLHSFIFWWIELARAQADSHLSVLWSGTKNIILLFSQGKLQVKMWLNLCSHNALRVNARLVPLSREGWTNFQ